MISEILTVEACKKININELLRNANKNIKLSLVKSQLELSGIKVNLLASKTRFGGERLWFACPSCARRVGTLFQNISGIVACRHCLNLRYSKSRFKGMAENS